MRTPSPSTPASNAGSQHDACAAAHVCLWRPPLHARVSVAFRRGLLGAVLQAGLIVRDLIHFNTMGQLTRSVQQGNILILFVQQGCCLGTHRVAWFD